MEFHQQNQVTNELAQLRNQILHKHCWLSIPAIVVLVISFTIVNFTINQQYTATSPQFLLPDMIEMQYNHVVSYFDFYHRMAALVMSANLTRSSYSSLADTVQEYVIPKTGMTCYIGTQQDCNSKFIPLATVSWQFKRVASLNQIIQRIFVCSISDTLTCAGNPYADNTLSDQQQQFIRQIITNAGNQSLSKSIFNININRGYLIAVQPDLIVTIFKLTDFTTAITNLFNQVQIGLYPIIKYSQSIPSPKSYQKIMLNQLIHPIIFSPKKLLNYGQTSRSTITTKSFNFGFNIKATKLSALVPLIFVVYLFRGQKSNITMWVQRNFARKKLINQLYKFTIRDIFTGSKLSLSNVLQRGPSSQLFRQLSGLVDKSIYPITSDPQIPVQKQAFKFNKRINQIIQLYKQQIKPLMHSKNKYILANRFNIQSYINDLCQAQNKLMKQYFVRAQQLNITQSFFRFAYVAILKSPQKFIRFIQQDQTPLPQKLTNYFIKTNQHIHQVDIIREKIENSTQKQNNNLTPNSQNLINEEDLYAQQNKEQLQIRIRVHIIPKYLAMLKDLDIQNHYADRLKLQRDLWSLGQIIENTRYLLTKHNKSIRAFSK